MTVALRPSLRLFAFVMAIVAVGAGVLDFVLFEYFGSFLLAVVSLQVYVGVGLLLVLRLPRQPVGWLLLSAGTLFQVSFAAAAYSWAAFIRWPGTLPLAELPLRIGWAWIPALGCLYVATALFPTGSPPSRRWRLPIALVVTTNALMLLASLVTPELTAAQPLGSPDAPVTMPNPQAIDGALGALLAGVSSSPVIPVVYLIPVAAVLARFRTATGNERQQLKWFAYTSSIAIGFFVAAVFVPLFSYLAGLGPLVAVVAMDLIPISVAIAILRYRLYDIDLLINRTLVYGVTTGAIALTFFGGVVVLPALLRPFISGSEIAVAVSTLVSFALFQPLRSRVQDAVDRRFYRSRYDAARTLDAFSVRLRGELDLDAVRGELLDAVGTTLSPTHAGVWLRETPR
jgi:hypothetical protein